MTFCVLLAVGLFFCILGPHWWRPLAWLLIMLAFDKIVPYPTSIPDGAAAAIYAVFAVLAAIAVSPWKTAGAR
jgi:hypothetical protein